MKTNFVLAGVAGALIVIGIGVLLPHVGFWRLVVGSASLNVAMHAIANVAARNWSGRS